MSRHASAGAGPDDGHVETLRHLRSPNDSRVWRRRSRARFQANVAVSASRPSPSVGHSNALVTVTIGLLQARTAGSSARDASPGPSDHDEGGDRTECGLSLPDRSLICAHFLTTYQLFWMSWSRRWVSTERKPAFSRYSRVLSSPHMAPNPSPPWARETVMQCMQEIV
jgi:hypothetical protein